MAEQPGHLPTVLSLGLLQGLVQFAEVLPRQLPLLHVQRVLQVLGMCLRLTPKLGDHLGLQRLADLGHLLVQVLALKDGALSRLLLIFLIRHLNY